MNIVARFTHSFLTRPEVAPFSEPEQELEWVCCGADLPQHRQTGRWHQLVTSAHQLQAEVPSLRVVVLIPAEYALIRHIDLPRANRRQRALAVPYLLEESLVGDVGDEHIVWSATPDGKQACCVVIRHTIMQALHRFLQGSGVRKLLLLPDALPLLQAGCTGLTVLSRDRALLVGAQTAAGVPLRQWVTLPFDQFPDTARLCEGLDASAEQDVKWPEHVQVDRDLDFFALLQASDVHSLEDFNLLSGPYRLASGNACPHRAVRYAAQALLFAWTLHIASDVALARYYAEQAQTNQQYAESLHAEYFPSEPYPANMARHLDAMAHELRRKQRPALFLSRHAQLVEALNTASMLDSVRPIDIHYNARTDLLNATLHIPSVAFSEQVIQAVEHSGGHVRLVAAHHAENGATIRIALSGPGAGGRAD